MSALSQAQQLFKTLQAALASNNLPSAESALSQLKLKLIELPSLPPTFQQTPTAVQELLLARDVFEQAVILAVKQQDEAAFERNFLQLKVYYTDTKRILPASPQENPIIGLNLLRLLVQNRIAEFHTELELISEEVQKDIYIMHAIQLEQWLMEGAYNKVLQARNKLPSAVHTAMTEQLNTTIRDEIANCAEKAYTRLSVTEGQKLLMLESPQAVTAYAQQHGWTILGDWIVFQQQDQTAAQKDLPSLGLIHNALVYAKELERIV